MIGASSRTHYYDRWHVVPPRSALITWTASVLEPESNRHRVNRINLEVYQDALARPKTPAS